MFTREFQSSCMFVSMLTVSKSTVDYSVLKLLPGIIYVTWSCHLELTFSKILKIISQGFFWPHFIANIAFIGSYSQLKIMSFFPDRQEKIPFVR